MAKKSNKPSVRKDIPPAPVGHIGLGIGDGGFNIAVLRARPHNYPTMVISHSAWGHGTDMKIHPSREALAELGKFFTRMSQHPSFKDDYCYPAGRYIWVDGKDIHPERRSGNVSDTGKAADAGKPVVVSPVKQKIKVTMTIRKRARPTR